MSMTTTPGAVRIPGAAQPSPARAPGEPDPWLARHRPTAFLGAVRRGAVRQPPLALSLSDPDRPADGVSQMERDDRSGGGTTTGSDYFPPELARLCTLATQVQNEHVNDHDLGAICGCAWPCARAEHNLALL
jgi:hypothetical protein